MRSTRVDIDLDAIAANVRALGDAARAEVIAVVKADAYGHGAVPVSRVALEAGAAMLAVATVEEGVVLRASGIRAPILVLLGPSDADDAAAAVRHGLACAVWDLERARLLSATGGRAAVHFKVDTGLTRLGAPAETAAATYRAVRGLEGIEIEGVFTHYATADEPGDTFAREQLGRFEDFVRSIGPTPRWVHAAASAGTAALGHQALCNAIRPGLALYGLSPGAHLDARVRLRPALSWRSAVHRVVDVPAGTGVSYGHEYRLPRPGRIATVPVGYGDGLPRSARGMPLLVRGQATPIVGRVCMDLVMLDVTGTAVAQDDEVVIVGEQAGARRSAEDVARDLRTINYEVVTNIRPRVPRTYRRGGRVVARQTLAEGHVEA
ncbi:MAG TPA: alanine racemase [Candidatus Limnocylindria bacterium]|nr:alanine racemase [Candidatus Limnocylindria bacterium]